MVRGAARLIEFLKQAYDGEELFRMPKPDGTLMHAEVRVGDSMIELADATEDRSYGDREGGVRDPAGNQWYVATHQGAESYIMPGLCSVTPYLHPEGAGRLLDFLKQAFGAEERLCERNPDGTIMHAKIRIGDSIVEMAEAHGSIAVPMPATFHLYVEDADAVYRRALEAGATSLREPRVEEYGERMAGVRDPAGNA